MSRAFAEGMCPEFRSGLRRFDLTTMFTIGHLMTHTLFTAEENGWQIQRTQLPAGNLVVCNTDVDQQNVRAQINIALEAISSSRVCIYGRNLTQDDWQVLRATGLPTFRRPANANVVPLIQTFDCPGIKFMIYNDQETVIPAPAAITALRFRHSLQRLAVLLRAETCYVKGYVRAGTMWCGRVCEQWSHEQGNPHRVAEQRYFNSNFETTQISLPRVGSQNFLWSLMNIDTERLGENDWPHLEQEWATLVGSTMREFFTVSAATSALYSLGVSTMLHTWNISGECLNVWLQPLAGNVCAVFHNLQFLFQPSSSRTFTTLSRMGSSFVGQFTNCTLLSKTFQSTTWCNGGHGIEIIHGDSFWAAEWGRNIPYIVDPLSVTMLLTSWPSTVGYASPVMSGNLSSSFVLTGLEADNYIAPHMSEPKYKSGCTSNRPFEYITQHTRIVAPLPISYRQWVKAAGMEVEVIPDWIEGADVQPEFDQDLLRYHAGTMPTYDWFMLRTLVPYVR